MQTGTVKWFDTAKRYGFITPDNGGPDVFLHLSAVAPSSRPEIQPGMRLQYDVERNGPKVSAKNVAPAIKDADVGDTPPASTPRKADFNDDFEKEWGLRPA
jgi:CspA family cold shock protein